MKKIITLLLLSSTSIILSAQVLTSARITDWSKAGLDTIIPYPTNQVDITTYGGVGDGTTLNNTAIASAIAALGGNPGIVYFPQGTFNFSSSINLPNGVILKGASTADSHLTFDLGGNGDCILMHGTTTQAIDSLAIDATKDSFTLTLTHGTAVNVGDYIRIIFDDNALLFSSWAYFSIGQICKITAKAGNVITLNSPLRMDFTTALHARIAKLTPRKNVGIECLSIQRLDASVGQTTTIDINNAVNCWLKNVEVSFCNFAHVAISNSSNILIEGSFFHEAFAYGGNGQGYGVAIQYASGECLIQNNIFRIQRHAMLIQAGANGNVCAYNYCREQQRTEFPSNAAGDMVLHGNQPFANLFESNSGNNITIDYSHGDNGPWNTYFRNRAALYGIIMSTPYSPNQNIVGNEITSTSFGTGNYIVGGTGLFDFGNNKNGAILPSGTTPLNDISYFFTTPPSYLQGATLPIIGIQNTINTGIIPAEQRWVSGNYVSCAPPLNVGITNSINETELNIFPNPTYGILTILNNSNDYLKVFNSLGQLVFEKQLTKENSIVDLSQLNNGVYTLFLKNKENDSEHLKVIKQ